MELRVLHQHGWSVAALAREFGLNWRTVKRELSSDRPRRYPDREIRTALTEAQLAHVERRLAVCPGIRGTILYEELTRDYGYAGSYPAFARHLRAVRPPRPEEAVVRFETDPGVQLQVDWAHADLWPLGGEMVELKVMVAILGYSRAPALRFATDTTRATTLERLVRCLDDLGGASHEILTDRDPAFCIGSTSDGRAILAPEWVDLCGVLGVVPKACRPYRARTKGKVERLVREVKESFFAWLSGVGLPARPTLDDYDALGRRWVDEVVLPRRHRTTRRVVREAWEEERLLLAPLPPRLLALRTSTSTALLLPSPVSAAPAATQRNDWLRGDDVQIRDLGEYDRALAALATTDDRSDYAVAAPTIPVLAGVGQ
jgi:transposase